MILQTRIKIEVLNNGDKRYFPQFFNGNSYSYYLCYLLDIGENVRFDSLIHAQQYLDKKHGEEVKSKAYIIYP